MSDTQAPERSMLWLTDRSRYESGLDHCLMERFLGYHFGCYGYGIQKQAQSIPLATGIYLHKATEAQDQYLLQHDELPPDETVREGVASAIANYERVITLRGLRNLDQSERTELVIQEQKALIEGLAWAYRLHFLPYLHEQCRVIHAEQEELLVLACTCGLGDRIGTQEEHEVRGCQGIGFQTKPDLLCDYRARPGVYSYWEKKSTSQTGERWETEWETKIQFATGAKATGERLGLPVQEAWVIGLIKGRREGEYDWQTKTKSGPLVQQSPLCYGWRRPPNPPLEPADWAVTYDYVDDSGQNRRLGKNYKKAGIWTIGEDLPDVLGSGVSVPEFWAKWMPQETLAKQLALVGPLQINDLLCEAALEEMVAHERHWQEIIWELYGILKAAGFDWTHPTYQAALRRLIPRSWACRRFGKRYQCQFVGICFQHEGWEDPLQHGYVPRRPHHLPELEQVRARGLEPEEGWVDEVEEE